MFRMVMMLAENDQFNLPDTIKEDMQKFVDVIKNDMPSPEIFAANGFGNQDMNEIFNRLVKSFQLTV